MGATESPALEHRYAVYDAIGRGGMATVHYGRVVGAAGFSRTVAIKRLHAHLAADPEFAAMLLDEARLAARVHHPNVVAILDVLRDATELSLVLEYVHGEALGTLLSEARRRGVTTPARVAVTIVAGILHGLHAAHEARGPSGEPLEIVHRDVSPHNIIVGADGVARLVDFGVAHAIGRVQVTRDGRVKGKLRYMAPEQLATGDVDRRADVYAAGIVLWEALTGKALFEGPTEGVLYGRVLEGGGDPPSQHGARVSRALDDIVVRALARDRATRFSTAREMALALEATPEMAVPSVVAAWVEELARDSLAARARYIASIEAGDAASAPVVLAADGATRTEATAPLAAPSRRAPARRAAWAAAAGAAIVLVVGSASLHRRSAAATAAPPEPAPASAAAAPPSVATSAASSASPTATATATAIATASAERRAPPRARPARPTTLPRSRECDPPTWIDDSGFKHYKPQCVR